MRADNSLPRSNENKSCMRVLNLNQLKVDESNWWTNASETLLKKVKSILRNLQLRH